MTTQQRSNEIKNRVLETKEFCLETKNEDRRVVNLHKGSSDDVFKAKERVSSSIADLFCFSTRRKERRVEKLRERRSNDVMEQKRRVLETKEFCLETRNEERRVVNLHKRSSDDVFKAKGRVSS